MCDGFRPQFESDPKNAAPKNGRGWQWGDLQPKILLTGQWIKQISESWSPIPQRKSTCSIASAQHSWISRPHWYETPGLPFKFVPKFGTEDLIAHNNGSYWMYFLRQKKENGYNPIIDFRGLNWFLTVDIITMIYSLSRLDAQPVPWHATQWEATPPNGHYLSCCCLGIPICYLQVNLFNMTPRRAQRSLGY